MGGHAKGEVASKLATKEMCKVWVESFSKIAVPELFNEEDFESVLAKGINSANHQAGTCKMGPSKDNTTVVNSRLQVHGISGLMVADASIFPEHILHNTNFTCMVIGEIAADIVTGEF